VKPERRYISAIAELWTSIITSAHGPAGLLRRFTYAGNGGFAGWAGPLAVDTLSRAIRDNGNVPAAHGNLALALVQQERLEEAVASYERQLALQPDHVDACTNLASVLSRMRLHDQALEGL
jgi:tetratricopeptide (TPR) repeat protein